VRLSAKQWALVLERLGYYRDDADPIHFLSSGFPYPLPKALFLDEDLELAEVDSIAPALESWGLPTEAISDAIEQVMDADRDEPA
jgi:hypothetical protein